MSEPPGTIMNLANQMKLLMEKHGKRPVDIHREGGVTKSVLSRVLNGQQTSVTDEDFERIAKVLGNSKQEQAQLVRARMLDHCKGPGSELVHVTVRGASSKEEFDLPMDPELRQALVYLIKMAQQNPHLRSAFISHAKLMGME